MQRASCRTTLVSRTNSFGRDGMLTENPSLVLERQEKPVGCDRRAVAEGRAATCRGLGRDPIVPVFRAIPKSILGRACLDPHPNSVRRARRFPRPVGGKPVPRRFPARAMSSSKVTSPAASPGVRFLGASERSSGDRRGAPTRSAPGHRGGCLSAEVRVAARSSHATRSIDGRPTTESQIHSFKILLRSQCHDQCL